jgi:hypothetical protein
MKKYLWLISLLLTATVNAETYSARTTDGRMLVLQMEPCQRMVIDLKATPYRGYSFRLQKVKPGQTAPQEHFCWGNVAGKVIVDKTEVYPFKGFIPSSANESNVGD